jgi:hypothetical protein
MHWRKWIFHGTLRDAEKLKEHKNAEHKCGNHPAMFSPICQNER